MPGFALSRLGAQELAALQPPINAAEFPRCQPGETVQLLSSSRRIGYREHIDTSTPCDQLRNVVLLPGIPGTRFFTHPTVQRLGFVPTWRLIVMERPGIGLSDPAPVPYTYTDFVADFREFCALLGLTRVSVIGFSAGTPFATAIACVRPQNDCGRTTTATNSTGTRTGAGSGTGTSTSTGIPGLGRPPPPPPPPGPAPAAATPIAAVPLSAPGPSGGVPTAFPPGGDAGGHYAGAGAAGGSTAQPQPPQPGSKLPAQPQALQELRPPAQHEDHREEEEEEAEEEVLAGHLARGPQQEAAQGAPAASGSASPPAPAGQLRPAGLRSADGGPAGGLPDGRPADSRGEARGAVGTECGAIQEGTEEGVAAAAAGEHEAGSCGGDRAATGPVAARPATTGGRASGAPLEVGRELEVEGVALVSAIGPPDTPNKRVGMALLFQFAYWACANAPWLVRWVVGSEAAAIRRRPLHALRKSFAPYNCPADVATLKRPEVERLFLESAMEMYGRGQDDAVLRENLLFAGAPWGFDLGAGAPRVAIWQGGQDRGCTPAMAAHLAALMGPQRTTLHLLPAAGHMLYFDVWDQVVDWVNGVRSG